MLRGINVGGHHKVPMSDLRQLYGELGMSDVATYIQSGNVVFSSARDDEKGLASELEHAMRKAFGFDVPVVLRAAGDLTSAVRSNPFVDGGVDASVMSVGFLDAVPEQARVRALGDDPLATPPPGGDEFYIRGREVYLHHPNGYGRSKLTNGFFDRRLGTMMTVRNWRTVLTLVEMTRARGM
jgi:uncharacterized protein (DUF1697 family)